MTQVRNVLSDPASWRGLERRRQMIIRCELKPGDRISEIDLGMPSVFKNTALRGPEASGPEGLVEIRPHRAPLLPIFRLPRFLKFLL